MKGSDNLLNIKAFRAEVKKRLFEKEWTYKDLAKATGYGTRTIEVFMGKCHDKCRDPSVNVAVAIAKALDIPEYMAQ